MRRGTLTVPGWATAADVVAAEVDEHDVLGALLFVRQQAHRQGFVLFGGLAARHRAGDWSQRDLGVLDQHEQLRGRRRRSGSRRN